MVERPLVRSKTVGVLAIGSRTVPRRKRSGQLIPPGSARAWISARRGDLLFAVISAAFAWASLTYPFGRDQGLYYYVGREWALRGAIPYRDVFDHKTPGLYFVHAICVKVFGETFWGIRLADLLAVLGVGWISGAIVANLRTMPKPPLRGLGCFIASVTFFGCLDFKATSEGEIWMALCCLASLVLTLPHPKTGLPPSRYRLFASGAMGAAGLLMKPLAAVLLLVVFLPLVWRGRRSLAPVARQLLAVLAGALAVLAPVTLYFLAHGALRAAYELVVEANSLYVREGSLIKKPVDLLIQTKVLFDWYSPFSYVLSALLAVATLRALVRKDSQSRQSLLLGLGLSLSAWATICIQGKFFQGHWGVMIVGVPLLVLSLVADAIKLSPERARRWIAPGASFTLVLLFLASERAVEHRDVNLAALRWVMGKATRDEFTAHFHEFFVGGPVADNEACGAWLREHTNETDFVAVRGFQPQVYASARRRYPGRLFWTVFALGPAGATHREKWLEEDRHALAANPPRFAATFSFVHGTVEATDWWVARGYTVRTVIGDFTIVERTAETATQPW